VVSQAEVTHHAFPGALSVGEKDRGDTDDCGRRVGLSSARNALRPPPKTASAGPRRTVDPAVSLGRVVGRDGLWVLRRSSRPDVLLAWPNQPRTQQNDHGSQLKTLDSGLWFRRQASAFVSHDGHFTAPKKSARKATIGCDTRLSRHPQGAVSMPSEFHGAFTAASHPAAARGRA